MSDMLDNMRIEIQPTKESKLSTVDFEHLIFGREFSDHLLYMDYSKGKWNIPRIVPFQNMSIHPANSALHYGQSIFEGMKAYRNKANEVFLFRPDQNIHRFNLSAQRMCMPEVPESIFLEGLKELIKLEKDWIPTSEGGALYIRPFMFSTDEFIGVKPSENYRFMIFCCPVNKYYNDPVRVKIEMKFSRAFEGGTGYAKAAGNYGGAMYPAKIGQEEGYQQLIWTDAKEHKYIEESGTMNLIFRMGDTVFSPAVSGTILNGVTRNSILQLARDYGYKVEERKVLVDEIVEALKTGRIDEAFGAGTAATIAPIRSIGYNDVDYPLSDSETWTFANRAKNELEGIKKGLMKDTHHWNVRVL